MKLDLPPPRDWQVFEDLCRDLWAELWGDPNAQKQGRTGQKQCGVDVFGQPSGGGAWEGVQCKRYERQLIREEIEHEVVEARKFKPRLQRLIIATTTKRDTSTQEIVREISDAEVARGSFSVSFWSWNDIADELVEHRDLQRRYYPALPVPTVPPHGDEPATLPAPSLVANRVVVTEFENRTGDPSLDHLGRTIAATLAQGLADAEIGLLPPRPLDAAPGENRIRAIRRLAEATRASLIVTGDYSPQNDGLRLQAHVTSAEAMRLVYSIDEISSSRAAPEEALEDFRQRLMGLNAMLNQPLSALDVAAISVEDLEGLSFLGLHADLNLEPLRGYHPFDELMAPR